MAPPSYLPRTQQITRSSSRISPARRFASSRQWEQGGFTKVLKASGLTIKVGSLAGSAAKLATAARDKIKIIPRLMVAPQDLLAKQVGNRFLSYNDSMGR